MQVRAWTTMLMMNIADRTTSSTLFQSKGVRKVLRQRRIPIKRKSPAEIEMQEPIITSLGCMSAHPTPTTVSGVAIA
jgi:hypothetical protein